MKAVYLVFVFIVLSAAVSAQNKVGPEEKAARRAYVDRILKNLPPNATQKQIDDFYKHLPKSTLDSLMLCQSDFKVSPEIKNVPESPYKAVPIPPYQGKEKIVPIPLNAPDVKITEAKNSRPSK